MRPDRAYVAEQTDTVIDVREPGKFASFSIPEAVKVPPAEIIVGRAGTARGLAGPAELMNP